MKTMFNGLVEFTTTEELSEFLMEITPEEALKLLEMGIEYGNQMGIYSLNEVNCLIVSLNKLKENGL